MTLLTEVMQAHGGAAHWRELHRFSAHLSISGTLLAYNGWGESLQDLIVDGSTQDQLLQLKRLTDRGHVITYRPDRVSLQILDGRVLMERQQPRAAFASHPASYRWDELQLAYFAGYLNWIYFTSPFALISDDVRTKELQPWQEDGQIWRRIRVTFPSRLQAHSPEQTYYFDEQGLQRRVDYRCITAGAAKMARYTWRHQEFCGIVVPTLCHAFQVASDGRLITHAPLFSIEVLDAAYD